MKIEKKRKLIMKKTILFGMISMVMASASYSAFAGCADVKAGPIWSNEDAKVKCPAVCASHDLNWQGNWVTTVWGKESVCGCCN